MYQLGPTANMIESPKTLIDQGVSFGNNDSYSDSLVIRSLSTSEKTLLLRKIQLLNKDEVTIKERSLLVELSLSDIDTDACKNVFDVFRKLNELQLAGKKIRIIWYFNSHDYEIRGAGEDFGEIFNLDIALIERKN